MYDSEETLYNTWFAELDEIIADFNATATRTSLGKFDASYKGNITAMDKGSQQLALDPRDAPFKSET